jgi:glutathione S-transferase
MRLFFSEGCPYAQRTRALLAHLGQPYQPEPVDLAHKPAHFLALSPTGAVPLLEDEGFVLYESAVINEYVAEKLGWADAWSPDVRRRALERLVMKRFDELVAPLFFQALKDASLLETRPAWRREVDLLRTAAAGRPAASLLGFHLAPHVLRMQWLSPDSPVLKALDEVAGGFLASALALPAIRQTSPDRELTVQQLRARFGP